MSAEPQASDFKPITFEAKPNPELIIKSVLEHFTYLKFRNKKGNTVSISEKSEIATTFYEELKFCHDQRNQAEQAFRDTVECLLKHHDKKVKKYVKHLKGDDCQFLTFQECNQYWTRLATEHYREEGNLYQLQHRANAEKRVMEFDTKIGQKWVDEDAVKPVLWKNIQITTMSKVEDDVGDDESESESDNDYDETGNKSDKNDIEIECESESDDDTTDDEFDESYCTAEIINISDHEAVYQHGELKKWVLENRRNVESTMKFIKEKKVDLDPKDASFVKRILDTWAYKWKSEFNETMSESTYTATWIAPDFEILKNKDPGLFNSSWCEMIHPSSKWRRQNVYKSNKKTGRKCDGIIFIKSSTIERLVFENVCSPKKEKHLKYYKDLNKSFRNAIDTLCKRFWTNRQGDVEICRKYNISVDLLSNYKLENQGELWRICLAGKDKFLAERIYKLEIPWKFEDDWTKLADVCKMLLLIE
ncbi:11274_t:CDS:10, partial [Ambispora leptoticha]